MSLSRLFLLSSVFALAASCASIDDPNRVSLKGQETAFEIKDGKPPPFSISIPDDRPNVCSARVQVDRLVERAKNSGLDFNTCKAACLAIDPNNTRLFGNCGTPDKGNWGFAGILEENGRGVHVLKELEIIPNTPQLTRRKFF